MREKQILARATRIQKEGAITRFSELHKTTIILKNVVKAEKE